MTTSATITNRRASTHKYPSQHSIRPDKLRVVACLPSGSPSSAISILEWATEQPASRLCCRLQHFADGRGRGLVATQDITPGQVILKVPLKKAYTSEPEHELELHWSADMAMRMLRDRHACQQANSSNSWCTWLTSLPDHVATPLEFGPLELAAVRDPLAAAEIQTMQACMQACYQELQSELSKLGFGWKDFLGAVQLLHSRCFFQPETGCHTSVPGIDMANHSLKPTARVEIVHSPAAVQGMSALEEVADADAARQAMAADPSCWVLRAAAPHGIRESEEITISYGPWPDTAFFLLFGFLPAPDNPNNVVVLFADVKELAEALITLFLQVTTGRPADAPTVAEQKTAILEALALQTRCEAMVVEDAPTWHSLCQLVVTKEGWDARLQAAVQSACQLISSSQPTQGMNSTPIFEQQVSSVKQQAVEVISGEAALQDCLRRVVVLACEQKLALLTTAEGGSSSQHSHAPNSLLQLARQFTARQVALLRSVLAALSR